MWSLYSEAKNTASRAMSSRRAIRPVAKFSRRSPPFWFSGRTCRWSRPARSLPVPRVRMIASREVDEPADPVLEPAVPRYPMMRGSSSRFALLRDVVGAEWEQRLTVHMIDMVATVGIALRMACSGASHSFNMLCEQVVDERLVAQPSPLGLPSHGVEHLRIDPNGDQPPGFGPQGRPPHASHRAELGGRSFRDVGEVNPGPPPRRPPALSGPPGVR